MKLQRDLLIGLCRTGLLGFYYVSKAPTEPSSVKGLRSTSERTQKAAASKFVSKHRHAGLVLFFIPTCPSTVLEGKPLGNETIFIFLETPAVPTGVTVDNHVPVVNF